MFETAPPSDKTFLLPSLRNAVVSALRTLNEATGVVTPATGYALPPTTTFDVSTAEDKDWAWGRLDPLSYRGVVIYIIFWLGLLIYGAVIWWYL